MFAYILSPSLNYKFLEGKNGGIFISVFPSPSLTKVFNNSLLTAWILLKVNLKARTTFAPSWLLERKHSKLIQPPDSLSNEVYTNAPVYIWKALEILHG